MMGSYWDRSVLCDFQRTRHNYGDQLCISLQDGRNGCISYILERGYGCSLDIGTYPVLSSVATLSFFLSLGLILR